MKYEGVGTNGYKKRSRWTRIPTGSILFVFTLFVYNISGFLCTLYPPQLQDSAADMKIPASATCVRSTRHADYVTVDVALGTPFRQFSLLLKLGSVLTETELEPAMILSSQQAVESETVYCDDAGLCNDVLITKNGTSGDQETAVVRFRYRSTASDEAYALGLDGELSLRAGRWYWLTSTQICFGESVALKNGTLQTTATVTDNKLSSGLEELKPLFAHVPLFDEAYNSFRPSDASDIVLFPDSAAVESLFLSIRDPSLYNREPQSVELRRHIVELGLSWARNVQALEQDVVLYKLDCQGFCKETSTLPFRRVATRSIAIHIGTDLQVTLWTKLDKTLYNLPKLADSTEAFVASLVKLLAIVVAASVVYVRAKRPTASSSWLLKHCLEQRTNDSNEGGIEDMFIGAIAIAIRGFLIYFRAETLAEDNQLRSVGFEAAATILSFCHWLMRYDPCKAIQDDSSPLTRFGGSTSLVDASAAVLVAFAETPTIVTSVGRFDPTARLLTSLLINLIVVTRCAFSAACCGILLENERNRRYKSILWLSSCMWVFQGSALAVIIADLFATPSAYSMSRSLAGDAVYLRTMLFLAMFCAGMPKLTATLRHVLSKDEHVD